MWQPLTRVFCAESRQGRTVFAHTYDAPDADTAIRIAERNGWMFVGEIGEGADLTDAEAAMLERDFNNHTLQ
jgi:hypothetical protein